MTRTIRTIGLKKLAAAALGILVLAPVAQAGDHDNTDVGFGVRTDNHGNFGIDFNIFSGRDRYVRPAPVVVERTERVWVEPVYSYQTDRVWVDAVYEKVCDRVWVEPVIKDVCDRVWIEPVYDYHDAIVIEHGRRVIRRVRVQVCAGRWEERHSTVILTAGHYDTADRWILKSAGHWEDHQRSICVSEGRWEDRVSRDYHRDYDRGDRYHH